MMRSRGGSRNTLFSSRPQLRPTTSMSTPGCSWLARQDLRMWASDLGRMQLSVSTTWARHLAARMPGRAVPLPSSRMRFPASVCRRSQRKWASTGAQGHV
ncbi:hypothetical protein M5D96_002968 [Drosophila gunungcola]|uniref:Uncharacterized protein n=1 Tax=Drosophila gunungcola TaxID=103775 RepID=A0A9P9Z1C3_9MUSC|nr:hypothetical protein M5D96_002968 [Drosophila gunungcola]